MARRKLGQKGLSLVEMLAMIGILSIVIVFSSTIIANLAKTYSNTAVKLSRDRLLERLLQNIRTEIAVYQVDFAKSKVFELDPNTLPLAFGETGIVKSKKLKPEEENRFPGRAGYIILPVMEDKDVAPGVKEPVPTGLFKVKIVVIDDFKDPNKTTWHYETLMGAK